MIGKVGTLKHISVFAVGLLVLVSTFPLFAQDSKRPVPSDAEQQQALALAREVYGEEYKTARTTDQKRALAEKILQKASESKDDPTAQYVLLRLAKDVVVPAGEIDLAMRAVDQIGATYQGDSYQIKMETFLAAAKSTSGTKQRASLAGHALRLVAEAVASDDFDTARKLCSIAQTAARQLRDRDLAQRVSSTTKEINQIATSFEVAKPFIAKLKEAPNDPNANSMAGRYQCFVKGNWAQGLPLLVQGNEEKTKSVAASELDGTVGKETALADQWWEVAEALDGRERDVVLLHAADLYRKALPQLSALGKAKVEKRLAEVKNTAVFTAEGQANVVLVSSLPQGAISVLTFEPHTFYREQNRVFVKDMSGKGGRSEAVGVELAEGKVGKAVAFKGSSFVALGGDFPKRAEPRTICVWAGAEAEQKIKQGQNTPLINWGTYKTSEKDRLLLELRIGKGTTGWIANNGVAAVPGDALWHHHAISYDGSEVKYYVDGSQIKSKAVAIDTDGVIILGHFRGPTDFIGSVDEIAVFNRALSDEEIKQVYELGVNGQNLVRRK